MNRLRVFGLLTLFFLSPAASSLSFAAEVNVYSARKEALIKPLLDKFTGETGIKVNLVTGEADALLSRLSNEGRNTPADLFITVDAGRLHQAETEGLLQPVDDARLKEAIPSAYRDPEGYWFGLSLRARVILYAKERVNPSELSSYEDLADPKWRGRICIRSSDNVYNQSLAASMIAAHGEKEAEEWVRGLVANLARPPKGGDRDQIKAAAAGLCDLAIANTYYYGGMLYGEGEPGEREAAQKMGLFWPNQNGRGAHVNISGAAITRYAKNRDNALRLLEYLVGLEAQRWYAEVNYEYPVAANVPVSDALKSWGAFTADSLNLGILGEYNKAAVKLMDRAGWK